MPIARSLVTNPSFILDDEPTGALNAKISVQIMKLLKKFHTEGKTIISIAHEHEIAELCEKTLALRDGDLKTNE